MLIQDRMNQGKYLKKLRSLSTPNYSAIDFIHTRNSMDEVVGVFYHNHHIELPFYLSYN